MVPRFTQLCPLNALTTQAGVQVTHLERVLQASSFGPLKVPAVGPANLFIVLKVAVVQVSAFPAAAVAQGPAQAAAQGPAPGPR